MTFKITAGSEVIFADNAAEALEKAGPFYTKGIKPTIAEVDAKEASQFGATVHDLDAEKRIKAQHAALQSAGVAVNAKEQLYATGTRMAAVGYETQRTRELEFRAASPIHEVAAALTDKVKSERRRDVTINARVLASKIAVTGNSVTMDGYRVTEQALRGMMQRIESGSLGYLLSVRDRIANAPTGERGPDYSMIVDVIKRELSASDRDCGLKLRVREGIGDCFAVVSPTYAAADAPEALKQIGDALPKDARGTFSYDPTSTAWQLRANVWTPTPAAEQAVGEAFEGYAALGGRDSGNGSVYGNGGVLLIRCLNASTYAAETVNARRVHRGRVLIDVAKLFKVATASIDALCRVWGAAREIVLPEMPTIEGVALAREIAMVGYFRGMLSDKRSELMGVLPGRTQQHVESLVKVYDSERRDAKRLVKADMGQAFTRYVQGFDESIQRDAESAVSQWLASDRKVTCDVKERDLYS